MKKFVVLFVLGLVPSVALAAGENMSDAYFEAKSPELTRQEKAALAIADKFSAANTVGVDPAPGPNGSIRFLYGSQQPSIVCAPLQVCDVALQPGEQVNSINLGDTIRWTVEPAITGSGVNEVQHLIIKPQDVGLESSLVVTTNRRTYYLRLRSHRAKYMPQVSFVYPEEASAKWASIKNRETKDHQDKTIPETGEYLGNLDFNYEIQGDAVWKPVRVYNDGNKTIIQMPSTLSQTEAPSLLVVRKDGGLFTDDERVMVNYRLQGDRYIVDTIFDKAVLIAGVGSNQDSVTILRVK
ncbi:MAG: P-type conjugative transfer protein TrbG [Alphaproteobacteria bacterium]|nr:P-type conjugative transfer protein TrbG [Alphaproteobacteria bacterium]